MLNRDRARWALASLIAIAVLSAPAIWNRFPLLQWDTGGYIARWYEHSLVISRSTVYGLFVTAGSELAFWPVVVAQSALTAWVMALTLRAVGLRNRPWLFVAIVTVLSALTTVSWLTSILLTDIFCVIGVLGLWLLLMHADTSIPDAAIPSTSRTGRPGRTAPEEDRHLNEGTWPLAISFVPVAAVAVQRVMMGALG